MNLRPGEKRLVVVIAVVFFIVINWLLVWPKFGDWKKAKAEMEKTRATLATQRTEIANTPQLQKTKERLEGQGSSLMPQEATVQLRRTIENQISQSGVIPNGITELNAKDVPGQFFSERTVSMGFVSTPDDALIDFLFNIGDRSMIRVRDLTIWPDASMQKLQGSIALSVSYQKRSTLSTNATSSGRSTASKTNAPAKPATNTTEKTEDGPVPSKKPTKPASTETKETPKP